LNNVNATGVDHAAIVRMVQGSKAATAAGHTAEADQLLARAAQLAPGHPAVLNELGLRMMQRGDAAKARSAASRHMNNAIRRIELADPGFWSGGLAIVAEQLEAAEAAAQESGRL